MYSINRNHDVHVFRLSQERSKSAEGVQYVDFKGGGHSRNSVLIFFEITNKKITLS